MENVKVEWSLGFTHNLGNFQSIRIDCKVQDHTRDGESVKDASNRVYKFVEEELIAKVNEAKAELDSL